jgi:hypothetical protein
MDLFFNISSNDNFPLAIPTMFGCSVQKYRQSPLLV